MTSEKFIRTPEYVSGDLTADEQQKMKERADLWISRAMRTELIEPDKITDAILRLYAAANLKAPRVVIVPSPLVLAMAGGFASAIWHARQQTKGPTRAATENATWDATLAATENATGDATRAATENATRAATLAATENATENATLAATRAATRAATGDATWAATGDATENATWDATWAATGDATLAATWDATWAATENATRAATLAATENATGDATRAATENATLAATENATGDATRAATENATRAATENATWDATRAATGDATRAATRAATREPFSWVYPLAAEIAGGDKNLVTLMLSCANNWWNCYQGGNMWAAYPAYLSAFRDVLGLRLKEHIKFQTWEDTAIHGGFRFMHDEFCLVSDFPEILLKDDRNRPHCDTGPSHRWRDGWELHHVHGVRVTKQIVEAPETLTIKQIEDEVNAEVRRVMIERFGQAKFLTESGAKAIYSDDYGTLYSKQLKDDPEPLVMVKVVNSTAEPDGTFKDYFIRVPPNTKTAREAVAWTFGMTAEQYAPLQQT